jgi:hypothetical protein
MKSGETSRERMAGPPENRTSGGPAIIKVQCPKSKDQRVERFEKTLCRGNGVSAYRGKSSPIAMQTLRGGPDRSNLM